MDILLTIIVLILSYIIGAVPFGLLLVKMRTGIDIRKTGSGRIGGTNVMRATGYPIGVLTVILDALKGAGVVWLARGLLPGETWLIVAAALIAVIGHNYSVFLTYRDEQNRLRLGGGAGGATCFGGAIGLWSPIILILLPVGLVIFFGVGYASLTTLSIGLVSALVFGVKAWQGQLPWAYVAYGLLAEVLLVWALRPNIRRLLNGTERGVSWRARKKNKISEDI